MSLKSQRQLDKLAPPLSLAEPSRKPAVRSKNGSRAQIRHPSVDSNPFQLRPHRARSNLGLEQTSVLKSSGGTKTINARYQWRALGLFTRKGSVPTSITALVILDAPTGTRGCIEFPMRATDVQCLGLSTTEVLSVRHS